MEPTREKLQDEIMEILYQKSLQKPVWATCAEIYWNIHNIKVTERSVLDVLEWLVKNDLVLRQADKYQIDKREFFDMAKRKATENEVAVAEASDERIDYGYSPTHTPPPRKNNLFCLILALVGFLLSGVLLGSLFFDGNSPKENPSIHAMTAPDSLQTGILQIRRMGYIPDAHTSNRNFQNISNAFAEQQNINQELLKLVQMQQEQLCSLSAYCKKQTDIMEQERKEMRIYLWMTGAAVLVLSLLWIIRYSRKG